MATPAGSVRTHYMPINLKGLLLRHGIKQTELGAAVIQANGAPLTKTAVSLISNWGEWPLKTPQHSIRMQITEYLRTRGVTEEEISTAFELDDLSVKAGPEVRKPAHLRSVKTPEAQKPDEEDSLLLEPVMLKPHAKRHFKLVFDPFKLDPSCSEEVFQGEEQRYVIASLREAIENTRMVGLVGESGSGKSTMWAYIMDQYAQSGQPVHLIQPMSTSLTVGGGNSKRAEKLTGTAVLKSIITALEPGAKFRNDTEMLSRQAHALVAEQVAAGQRCCIVFEEAHDLSMAAIKQLKRFHEFKIGAFRRLLSIVLLAQPELLRTLNRAGGEAREVANRLEIIRMLPLENDLEPYIAHRLGRGSVSVASIFTADAIDTARKILVGERDGQVIPMSYPLLVGNLLTRAMNLAADLGAPKVDAAIVRDAAKRGN